MPEIIPLHPNDAARQLPQLVESLREAVGSEVSGGFLASRAPLEARLTTNLDSLVYGLSRSGQRRISIRSMASVLLGSDKPGPSMNLGPPQLGAPRRLMD